MKNTESPEHQSVFRTEAWVQAWIDTWGKDPRIQLIDLGGRKRPLEHVYITKYRLKKILPVNTLCLAGTGFGALSTPRAEYNDINPLIVMAGGTSELIKLLSPLGWQQFVIPDIDTTTSAVLEIEELIRKANWNKHIEKNELAYSIGDISFEDYLKGLGKNTRLAYFNRRERLRKHGSIAFVDYDLQNSQEFFEHLNRFHINRWGTPCYSPTSQAFLQNFAERLTAAGGNVVMQELTVNAETISVLFDVVWGKTRYNFQSGYAENRFPKISLGSIHLGYAVQSALDQQKRYDFMAGNGKHRNYKTDVANSRLPISTWHISRGSLALLRTLIK